jgi:Mce-associated membrane protein
MSTSTLPSTAGGADVVGTGEPMRVDLISEAAWSESDPEAVAEPDAEADADAPGGASDAGLPRRRRWYRSAAIPWALLVLALTAAAIFASLWQRAQALENRRAEIVSTADHFLAALTTFKAATIESDVTRIRGYAVGDFADQVGQFFGPSTVASIKRAGVVSVGSVRSVFVQTVNGSTATVLGVVNESVTNTSTPTPRTEVVRVVVELIQTRSGWRVDKVDVLQTPDQSSPLGS